MASAVFIAISLSYRLFAAIYTVATKNKEINSLEWLWVIMGTFISMLDPWNGALVRSWQSSPESKYGTNSFRQ